MAQQALSSLKSRAAGLGKFLDLTKDHRFLAVSDPVRGEKDDHSSWVVGKGVEKYQGYSKYVKCLSQKS